VVMYSVAVRTQDDAFKNLGIQQLQASALRQDVDAMRLGTGGMVEVNYGGVREPANGTGEGGLECGPVSPEL
jgi:hypothetical protein